VVRELLEERHPEGNPLHSNGFSQRRAAPMDQQEGLPIAHGSMRNAPNTRQLHGSHS
jgi:hypothetical protein